ncbi:MAG: hypothetical protein Q7J71_02540 [Polaromonas sp.]|nr:hypothetical protein [Polaromonas sp.]
MKEKTFHLDLPAHGDVSGYVRLLQEAMPYSFQVEGGKLVATRVEGAEPTAFVELFPFPIELNQPDCEAKFFAASKSALFDEAAPDVSLPRNISILSDFGFASKLHSLHVRYFLARGEELHQLIRTELIPWLSDIGVRRAFQVKANTKIQLRMSFAKIAFGIRRLGIVETGKMLEAERQNPLPDLQTPLQLVDALLVFGVQAIAVPMERFGNQLLLVKAQHWVFPNQARQNIVELWFPLNEPFSSSQPSTTFALSWQKRQVEAYLALCVEGTNRLLEHVTDPINYKDGNGKFDEILLIKAATNVNLMIADALSIAQTSNQHTKQRAFFSFLDKLSNLALWSAGSVECRSTRHEARLRNWLFACGHGDLVVNVIRRAAARKNTRLGEILEGTARTAFDVWVRQLHASIPASWSSPKTGLDSLMRFGGMLRNLSHGTSSPDNRFDELLLHANVQVPRQLDLVMTFTLLALCCEPDRMLRSLAQDKSWISP